MTQIQDDIESKSRVQKAFFLAPCFSLVAGNSPNGESLSPPFSGGGAQRGGPLLRTKNRNKKDARDARDGVPGVGAGGGALRALRI